MDSLNKEVSTNMLKIIIISKGRPMSIKTHLWLGDVDYKIVLHNEEERQEYLKNPTIDPNKIVVSNQPFGISVQRQWIQDNLIEMGECYISLDDNIKEFTAVDESHYPNATLPVTEDKSLRFVYQNKCSPERFLNICKQMIEDGEKIKAYNMGFATVDNFFFREKKYRYVGFVCGKATVRKKTDIKFSSEFNMMEDYAYTAEHLLQNGAVLINNFVFPVAGHYEKGGIGSYADRLSRKIQETDLLLLKYPNLFIRTNKKNADPRAEVQIKFHSYKQVENWRLDMKKSKLF